MFETPGRLASWTGICPSSNESAGRIKSSHILPGNKYLKSALGVAALSASRSKNTYLAAKYRRIAARRGPMKAIVALENSTLNAAWHMLATGECYDGPGADHFTRLRPHQIEKQRDQETQQPRLHRHHHPGHRSLTH